jgi:hypothetical protein
LRKQIIELEKELGLLRAASADPQLALAQGDDRIEWKVRLEEITEKEGPIRQFDTQDESVEKVEHPARQFEVAMTTTWNEIFILLFPNGTVTTSARRIEEALDKACVDKAIELDLLGEDDRGRFEVAPRKAVWDFMATLSIQFSGLDYIDVTQVLGGPAWALTPRGKGQVALIMGKKRPLAGRCEESGISKIDR